MSTSCCSRTSCTAPPLTTRHRRRRRCYTFGHDTASTATATATATRCQLQVAPQSTEPSASGAAPSTRAPSRPSTPSCRIWPSTPTATTTRRSWSCRRRHCRNSCLRRRALAASTAAQHRASGLGDAQQQLAELALTLDAHAPRLMATSPTTPRSRHFVHSRHRSVVPTCICRIFTDLDSAHRPLRARRASGKRRWTRRTPTSSRRSSSDSAPWPRAATRRTPARIR